MPAVETTEVETESEPSSSEEALPERSRWGVLRHRHYRNVWAASFVSNVGHWMEMVGIQMIVAKATGSLKMLGYFAAAQLLPILVLGILGGLVADRVNRKKLLVSTQAVMMVLAGLVAACSYWHAGLPEIGFLARRGESSGLVGALFILSVLQGVVLAFNIPAWQVLVPRLVPREELTKAINLNGIQFNAARVVGPALAGVILGLAGATPLFVINTITFMAVLVAVMRTPDSPAPRMNQESPMHLVREASRFIFRSRGPLCVFIAMVLMSALAAPLLRMLPLYVIDVYQLTGAAADATVGWLISVLGLGAVLGGLALRYVPTWYPRHHFIPAALAGAGLSIVIFSLTRSLWTGYLAMFVVGVFWIWGFNSSWAAMQTLVSDSMRGRVMALAVVASFGVNAIGNIAAGWIGETAGWLLDDKMIGTQMAEGVLALALLVAGIVMLVWRVPEVDGIEPGHRDYGPRRNLIDGITARNHRPRRAGAR